MDQVLSRIGVQVERGTTIHNISDIEGLSVEFISNVNNSIAVLIIRKDYSVESVEY